MNNTSQRTQIILPMDLRKRIDSQRRVTGETLAKYLRRAAEERLKKQKIQKESLKKLADAVVGSIKKGAWSGVNVEEWQRHLREKEDKHLDKILT